MNEDIIARLAVMQAVYKAVADEVSTKNPDGVRGQADEYMRQRYIESGEKVTKRLYVNGAEVGTISTKESKPVPQKQTVRLEVCDLDELAEWEGASPELVDEFYETVADELVERFGVWHAQRTGEVPPGMRAVTDTEPERPREYAGTVLKVDAGKVAQALRGQLPAVVRELLEGGE